MLTGRPTVRMQSRGAVSPIVPRRFANRQATTSPGGDVPYAADVATATLHDYGK